MTKIRILDLLAACATVLTLAPSIQAETISFVRVTGIGQRGENEDLSGQLFVDVNPNYYDYSLVDFRFYNEVGVASSLTDIYYDDDELDGSLSSIAFIDDSDFGKVGQGEGVSFSQGASPPNLPNGENAEPPFLTTPGFSADANEPEIPSGVNEQGEWVTITFYLNEGYEFQDTIDALEDQSLRIGIFVQGIGATGGSDSYVSVPEPSAALLAVLGLGIAGRRLRRTF